MKNIILMCGIAACLALSSGCEWTSVGGVEYWDTSWDEGRLEQINFSGTYRAPDGGLLVRAHDVAETVPTAISAEELGTGDGTRTAFGGSLAHRPVSGSLNIEAGGYVFWDIPGGAATANLRVTPDDGTAGGTINYDTGAWSLSFEDPLAAGTPIFASYTYLTSPHDVPGNTGKPIFSFVISQTGNKLQFIDSNNGRYKGTLGDAIFGEGRRTDVDGATETEVSAAFSAFGASREGYQVTIVGTLKKGTILRTYWTGQYDDAGRPIHEHETIGGYGLEATWIEEDTGSTAYIEAVSEAFPAAE